MESSPASWILAIDLGTGGAKVAAVGLNGAVRSSAFRRVEMVNTADGGAEQDPNEWWRVIQEAIQETLGAEMIAPAECVGVGLTGQWGSTIPVRADGSPIGPALIWSDDRGGEFSKTLVSGTIDIAGFGAKKVVTWIRLAGGAPAPHGADPTGHVQFLKHRRPDVYREAAAFVEPVDFVGACLTKRIAATPASMVLSWLTDNRVDAPVSYNAELVKLADRDPNKLPTLLPTGSILGSIDDDVARFLGLPLGVAVVCGLPDLHTAALGAAATRDYEGHLSIATSAWVSAPVPFKKTDVIHQMTSIPGLRSGSYLIANNHETGGATLRWLRDQVLMSNDVLGPDHPVSYDSITEAASSSAPGSGGVIFTPWLAGERSPVEDRNLRASFINMSLTTTRADLCRSVLEGVAYNARWLLEATEGFANRKLDGLRILGGGAQSDLWCQIHADVIGRPILRMNDPVNVNVRGAAWFAALSLQLITEADIEANAPKVETFYPQPDAVKLHEPLYAEFVKLAKQQKNMFKRLNGKRR